MYSKIKLMGHPLHPMLIAYPVALYTATLVCYLVYAVGGDPFWFRVGYVANVAGVVMAIVTALPGFADWLLGIPTGTPAKQTGLYHMLANVGALLLFILSAVLNAGQWNATTPGAWTGLVLALVGVGLTIVAGFFGWSLIQDHHVGVHLTPEQQRLEPSGGAQASAQMGRAARASR